MHNFLFPAQLQCHQDSTLPIIKHCTITWKGMQWSTSLRWTSVISSSVHGRRVAFCSIILHVFPTFTETLFSLYTYWYSTFKIRTQVPICQINLIIFHKKNIPTHNHWKTSQSFLTQSIWAQKSFVWVTGDQSLANFFQTFSDKITITLQINQFNLQSFWILLHICIQT